MTGRLHGKVIATTRGEAAPDALTGALEEEGARVLSWATHRFEGPTDPDVLRSRLAEGGVHRWIVFTSPRAVHGVVTHGGIVDPGVRVAAVGPSTATALRSAGYVPDVVGRGAGASGLAAAVDAVESLAGRRVLFPAGDRALPTVEDEFGAVGATVERVEAYRTVVVPPRADGVRAALAGGVDAVTFASPSSVEALAATFDGDLADALSGVAVCAVGPTTARALRDRGVHEVVVAEEAGFGGLVEAVVRAVHAHGRDDDDLEIGRGEESR
ncbi:MAG: uroporphyrinogen-III synthase [Gemmatimonadota bacterium]|nr:uroporphyrinogen-III synthase [Gemmatimonadota bacterium]MDH5759903.1 uroporphyrinogen-III synthase [Gemmatimonadota bacterium]